MVWVVHQYMQTRWGTNRQTKQMSCLDLSRRHNLGTFINIINVGCIRLVGLSLIYAEELVFYFTYLNKITCTALLQRCFIDVHLYFIWHSCIVSYMLITDSPVNINIFKCQKQMHYHFISLRLFYISYSCIY